MKHFFYFTLCLFLFSMLGTLQAQDNVVDEVIWVVGDDAILKSDVEMEHLQNQMRGIRVKGDPYCTIAENLAVRKLFLHQAKLDSIDVADSQVYSYVEQILNEYINEAGSKEKLEEYWGKSINQIREEQRELVKEGEIVNQMKNHLTKSVKITPVDVRRFYNRIPQDSLPYIPTTVEVEILTIEPKISLAEIDDIKNRLREFSEEVTSGRREFSTLARLWSEDKGSGRNGGELGLTGKGMLDPEFASVAFELNDPKKVSRIVESEYGYHIIQLIEKRGDRINCRHILLKPQASAAELEAARLRIDSIRTNIVNGEFSFEEAATFLSFDKDTRNNNGLMVNHGGAMQQMSERVGTSRFEMEELPAEMGNIVYNMQVGEVSKPFSMINSKQKEVLAIVKLKSRIEGHKASLADDYQELKSMVMQEKSEEILSKWLAKKQKETYIRINDEWKNCDFQYPGWVISE